MKAKATALLLVFVLGMLTACGGGGGGGPTPNPPPAEATAVKLFTYPSGAQWIEAPPNTAVALSDITIVADSQEYTTTALQDGSISYKFTVPNVRTISVDYLPAGGGRKNIRPDVFIVANNITHDFVTLGMAPNDFFFFGGKCYVVNSMDNNLQIFNATDFSPAGGLTFPAGASPSYIYVRDGLGVVTCNGNNRVVAFNPDDGTELWSEELPSDTLAFLGPGRPFANQERIYVPLANISEFGQPGDSTLYDPAQLAVINIGSKHLENIVNLNGLDAVEIIPIGGNQIAICEAGDFSFDANFVPFVFTSTFIDIYDLTEQAVSRTLSLGVVGGGRMLYDEQRQRLLIGSLLDGRIYEISTDTWLIERGLLNPIDLSDNLTYVSGMVLMNGTLLAASFNEDLVYSLDAEDYTLGQWPLPDPLPLEQEASFLAGPQALRFDATKNRLLILEGLANRITEFKLPVMP
jgi:hypothetical protein